jgi:phospholipid/cholesterol/gamma-HCH transport system permease protein
MRASLIAIATIVLLTSLALYGTDANFNLTV